LGVSEWLFGVLLFWGFWNKKAGIVGELSACFSFTARFTILPFFPNVWEASAGGFPAMTEHVGFLMKDLELLAVSFNLLREDVKRVSLAAKDSQSLDKAFLQDEPSRIGTWGKASVPFSRIFAPVFKS
jgi:uncharacterized membrane protein YkgB